MTPAANGLGRRAWLAGTAAAHWVAPTRTGVDADTALQSGLDIRVLLDGLGHALRDLHATEVEVDIDIEVEGGPFDAGVGALLGEARERVRAGLVDAAGFDAAYRRVTPDELLAMLEADRPVETPRAVPVVGEARLATVRIDAGHVVGWSDWQRSGLGDPYRDIATVAADLAFEVSPEALAPFVEAYGLDRPDLARLDWHVMLDQLLR